MSIVYSPARVTELETAGELDNPFVAYDNLAALSTSTLGGTATLTDGAAANAVSGTTYDYWLPNVTTTSAQFRVTFPSAITINTVAIAAHNLSDFGGTVVLQRSTNGGGSWSSSGLGGSVTPSDNSVIMFRVASTGNDAADWRLNFTGLTAGDGLAVGVAYFGNDMVFPRRFYRDFAPPISPSEVQLQSNVSVGGNLLGNSVIARGTTLTSQVRNLADDWIRGAFKPFIPHFNAGKGFFFGWRPTTYVDDVRYCWRDGATLRPVNSGPLAFMSVEMAMRAYEA